MINVNSVSKSFDELEVLKNVTHTFNDSKTTVIIGASGSGKSTLLRCMNQLVQINSGNIYLDNEDINDIKHSTLTQKVGMVFQQFNLFSNMTALENVTYALLKVKKMSKEEANKIALKSLEQVNILDKINSYPQNLSGGQKQRVAIARALVLEPNVMLFDEPTSALDPETVNEVLDIIKQLTKTGLTSIIVTHEIGFAKEIADEVIYMDDGKIIEYGTVEEVFNNPLNDRTKQFLNKIL